MKEYFNLTEEQYNALKNKGITDVDFFNAIPIFKAEGGVVSKICLCHYADSFGDFIERSQGKYDLIANAVFDNLPVIDKIELAEYIEFITEGE